MSRAVYLTHIALNLFDISRGEAENRPEDIVQLRDLIINSLFQLLQCVGREQIEQRFAMAGVSGTGVAKRGFHDQRGSLGRRCSTSARFQYLLVAKPMTARCRHPAAIGFQPLYLRNGLILSDPSCDLDAMVAGRETMVGTMC